MAATFPGDYRATDRLPAEYQVATLQTLRHKILLMPAHLQRIGNRPRLSLPVSGPREAAWEHPLRQINSLPR
jgi:hypothetical protein